MGLHGVMHQLFSCVLDMDIVMVAATNVKSLPDILEESLTLSCQLFLCKKRKKKERRK